MGGEWATCFLYSKKTSQNGIEVAKKPWKVEFVLPKIAKLYLLYDDDKEII